MKKRIRKAIESVIEEIQRYLPEATRALIMAENRRLEREAEAAEEEIGRLRAYITGMEAGLRTARKIVINNNGGKEEKK